MYMIDLQLINNGKYLQNRFNKSNGFPNGNDKYMTSKKCLIYLVLYDSKISTNSKQNLTMLFDIFTVKADAG